MNEKVPGPVSRPGFWRIAGYMLLMGVLVWFLSFFVFPKAVGWEMSQSAIDRIPIFGFAIGAAPSCRWCAPICSSSRASASRPPRAHRRHPTC